MVSDRLDEQWDLYDRALHRLGTQRRGDPMPPGTVHLTVAALVFGPDGRVLLQRRSPQKLHRPNTWDASAGGSVLLEETPAQAVRREVQEELGLTLAFAPADRFARVWHATWVEDWFTVGLPTVPVLHRQQTEVAALTWCAVASACARLAAQGDAAYADQVRAAQAWLARP
ncbi:NUDIX domain-containing protein [Lacticaseibacillus absianus]|uniref:NUDIX domain-containing protein n=1 Tax=Lacticaseibacillus absianus TaxID=2729623 RepID=UPI0015CEAC20|nr:NUDIX domain-containing protein [Lacticaseibacillus absianus]